MGPLGAACGLALVLALAALAAPGDLDPTFGAGGRVALSPALESAATSVVVQPDGKLVLAGLIDDQAPPPPPPPAPFRVQASNADFLVARLTPAGSPDLTFGTGGVVRTPIVPGSPPAVDSAQAVAVGPDGKIVLAGLTVTPGGTDFAFARYTSLGALDPTFSGDGIKTVHVGTYGGAGGVAVQPDGKVVAVGGGGNGFTMLRLRPNGDLDPSFGTGGVVETTVGNSSLDDEANGVVLVGTKIVVAGTADMQNPTITDFAVARYLSNGHLDPTFGSGGVVVTRGSSGNGPGRSLPRRVTRSCWPATTAPDASTWLAI